MNEADEKIVMQLQVVKQKSEENYEKSITLISSGTLLLSLTFIEKIIKQPVLLWLLIVSWCLLAFTLLTNLISHQVSSHLHERTVQDFRDSNPETLNNVSKRNRTITWINWGTTACLISGICFLIIFCSINAYKMNRDTDQIKPQTIEPDQQKGMPINIPRGPSPAPSQQPSTPPPAPSAPITPPANPNR